jgi:H+/gluconate symporter-like permease
MRGIPTRLEAQQLTVQPLLVTTLIAILTAIQGSATTTAAITKGSTSGPQVERIYEDLGSQGYIITDSGSTFTVSW